MPSLAQYTDYYEQPDQTLPVEQLTPGGVPVVNGIPRVEVRSQQPVEDDGISATVKRIGERLLGLNGQERYQLWPEKLVREAVSTPHDVMTGEIPQYQIDPVTGAVHTSPQMVEGAQAVSALAGSGGLSGVTDATLGATPFLRPALKYRDKLYKGKEGEQHMDVIPESLYPDFQKKAMSGEDINDYRFGFVNDKGHFLDREAALKYGIDTGLVDPQAGKYGALTSTLMADSSKPGTAIEAMAKTNAPTFYSALEHQVNAIGQGKMTGDQWLGTLSNKPGVKPEELDWTGLRSFLEENKGTPVTKEQVKEYLDSNKVELKEVNKGELKFDKNSPYALREVIKAAKEAGDSPGDLELVLANDGDAYRALTKKFPELVNDEDWAATVSKSVFGGDTMPSGTTKYHSYQLPGGENYRELTLTLPKSSNLAKNELDALHVREKEILASPLAKTAEGKQELAEINNKIVANRIDPYRSSHWDEPNILAHVRMNDRVIDGKKSLHVEEIQSDWHQQGRDQGYKQSKTKDWKISGNDKDGYEIKSEGVPLWEGTTRQAAERQLADMRSRNVTADKGVPDAPFKKTWHELAIKRMLREAAEKSHQAEVSNWNSLVDKSPERAAHLLSHEIPNLKIVCQ